ncbi:MAG: type VI secretion system tip protein VgrG, partial [Burkholderiales bacterium]|nr:type VI secretion system tip protein VgrG [Burkholderiales bacterium]
GQIATLEVSLSDARRTSFTGLINQVAQLGSDGGLARYRLRVVPWLWLLTQSRCSRVWQDQSVIEIVEAVFSNYGAHASWRWSDEVESFMQGARVRSYCVQYRESDYDFVQRLLTEEGLNWRLEEAPDAPSGHQVVLFAESTEICAVPVDATSAHRLGGKGIRYHGGRSREEQDSIQVLTAKRSLNVALTTLLSYDYKTKQSVIASVPTDHQYGGSRAPILESYDTTGVYTWASAAEAQRYGRLHQQAHEARNKLWHAGSTVRTLRPGTRFSLSQSPLNSSEANDSEFVVLRVHSLGINNLPRPAQEAVAEMFGAIPVLLKQLLQSKASKNTIDTSIEGADKFTPVTELEASLSKALELGYANQFDAIRADIPWRPSDSDQITDPPANYVSHNGSRQNSRPTAFGSQSAIVVGPDGLPNVSGADEIYCDRLGRVRIRFHWQGQDEQQDAHATCWVRVAQRQAGGGMGVQFLPRIGQEVLVQFIEGDIDRPLIIGALYNGQGEGGIVPSPAGEHSQTANLRVYQAATDHQASAQGNLVMGHAPVWHGASADSEGHRNPSAQWGIRSKEYGGNGYNQLNFDDTDRQGRIQLKSTQAATALNLGHLIHTADNYRGSFRGQGAELRTDAYGAMRAGAGHLISSYGIEHTAAHRTPAGDNVAGMALMKQAVQLSKSFSDIAKVHQTVAYASHIGSTKSGISQLGAEKTRKPQAPVKALHTAVSGTVTETELGDAQATASDKNTETGKDKIPHSTDPIIAIAAQAGMGIVAGQNLQFANGETNHFLSGQDSQFITGNQTRLHTGQAIGMLGGAVKPGENQLGMQWIAGKDNIDIQAQSDDIRIQARDHIDILSSHAHIDWAAAKSISLSTADGANITIEGGNITVQCPGKITIHAGKKSFLEADRLEYPLPQMPRSICVECLKKAMMSASPLAALS